MNSPQRLDKLVRSLKHRAALPSPSVRRRGTVLAVALGIWGLGFAPKSFAQEPSPAELPDSIEFVISPLATHEHEAARSFLSSMDRALSVEKYTPLDAQFMLRMPLPEVDQLFVHQNGVKSIWIRFAVAPKSIRPKSSQTLSDASLRFFSLEEAGYFGMTGQLPSGLPFAVGLRGMSDHEARRIARLIEIQSVAFESANHPCPKRLWLDLLLSPAWAEDQAGVPCKSAVPSLLGQINEQVIEDSKKASLSYDTQQNVLAWAWGCFNRLNRAASKGIVEGVGDLFQGIWGTVKWGAQTAWWAATTSPEQKIEQAAKLATKTIDQVRPLVMKGATLYARFATQEDFVEKILTRFGQTLAQSVAGFALLPPNRQAEFICTVAEKITETTDRVGVQVVADILISMATDGAASGELLHAISEVKNLPKFAELLNVSREAVIPEQTIAKIATLEQAANVTWSRQAIEDAPNAIKNSINAADEAATELTHEAHRLAALGHVQPAQTLAAAAAQMKLKAQNLKEILDAPWQKAQERFLKRIEAALSEAKKRRTSEAETLSEQLRRGRSDLKRLTRQKELLEKDPHWRVGRAPVDDPVVNELHLRGSKYFESQLKKHHEIDQASGISTPFKLDRQSSEYQNILRDTKNWAMQRLDSGGVYYDVTPDGTLQIRPDGNSHLNRWAASMQKRFGVRIEYDPSVELNGISGAYNNKTYTILISTDAVSNLRSGGIEGHEIIHALSDFDRRARGGMADLHGSFYDPLGDGSIGSRYFSNDELKAGAYSLSYEAQELLHAQGNPSAAEAGWRSIAHSEKYAAQASVAGIYRQGAAQTVLSSLQPAQFDQVVQLEQSGTVSVHVPKEILGSGKLQVRIPLGEDDATRVKHLQQMIAHDRPESEIKPLFDQVKYTLIRLYRKEENMLNQAQPAFSEIADLAHKKLHAKDFTLTEHDLAILRKPYAEAKLRMKLQGKPIPPEPVYLESYLQEVGQSYMQLNRARSELIRKLETALGGSANPELIARYLGKLEKSEKPDVARDLVALFENQSELCNARYDALNRLIDTATIKGDHLSVTDYQKSQLEAHREWTQAQANLKAALSYLKEK